MITIFHNRGGGVDGVPEAIGLYNADVAAGVTDLARTVAEYVAIGRFITVLDLDQTCVLVN